MINFKKTYAILTLIISVFFIILGTDANEISKNYKNQAATITSNYLLAFHACNTTSGTIDCGPPTNHYTYLAQSNDGENWSLISSGGFPFQGSVPDVIQKGNYLYIYTPGVVNKYNISTNMIESTSAVTILDQTGNREDFVDPSPILDSNGNIVLFYLYSGTSLGVDPAMCRSSEALCTKVFRSATEISGSDGTRFQSNINDRAAIEISGTATDAASDPDIFAGSSSGYYLYISRGNSTQVLFSSTLHGTYTSLPLSSSGILVDNVGGVPAGHFDSNTNQYWTYTHTGMLGQNLSVRRATHSDFNNQLTDSNFATVISGTSIGLGNSFDIASPGFLEFDRTLSIGSSSGGKSSSSSSGNQTSSSSSGSSTSGSSTSGSSTSSSSSTSGSPSLSITGNSIVNLNGASSTTETLTVTASGFTEPMNCTLITSKKRVIAFTNEDFTIHDPSDIELVDIQVNKVRRVTYPTTVTVRVACKKVGQSMAIKASFPIDINR